jgi:hypothetical protein
LAVANYEAAHGRYPPAHVVGPDGKPWHSWRVLILPYIGYESLHERYRMDEPWDGPNNVELVRDMPKVYRFSNRRDPGQTTTNYLAVVGPGTMWPGAEGRKAADVTDGQSQTVLIAENRGLGVTWTEPRDLALDAVPLEFNHPLGLSSWYKTPAAVMADGSLLTFGPGTRPEALRAMLTANGGERVAAADGGWHLLPDGRQRDDAP